jgi:hypothetical protein
LSFCIFFLRLQNYFCFKVKHQVLQFQKIVFLLHWCVDVTTVVVVTAPVVVSLAVVVVVVIVDVVVLSPSFAVLEDCLFVAVVS